MSINFNKIFKGGKSYNPPKGPSRDGKTAIYLTKSELEWNSIEKIINIIGESKLILSPDYSLKLKPGYYISGKKIPHKEDKQDEGNPMLNVKFNFLKLVNFWFDDMPGGISIKSYGVEFDNITMTQIGEDAISTPINHTNKIVKVKLLIKNGTFYNGVDGDKTLQFNNPNGCVVSSTSLYGGTTGMRIGESSDKNETSCLLKDVDFNEMDTAINADGNCTISMNNIEYNNVNTKLIKKGKTIIKNI